MSDPLKGLQAILGTDKKNPMISVYRDAEKRELHVYYGFELLEIVPDDKSSPHFKLMVAQLYNAGIRGLSLIEVFNVDPKSMRKWGRALKSGDPETLVRALQCRGPRKLTPEIQAYIRYRFKVLYDENPRNYIPRIRQEILEIFKVSITAEGLRPFLGELKAQRQSSTKPEVQPVDPSPAKTEVQVVDPSPAKLDVQADKPEIQSSAPSPTKPDVQLDIIEDQAADSSPAKLDVQTDKPEVQSSDPSPTKPEVQPSTPSSTKLDLRLDIFEDQAAKFPPTNAILPSETPRISERRPPDPPSMIKNDEQSAPQGTRQAEESSAKKGALAV